MLLLQVYVPESHLEPVKAALFAAGAGRIGSYDSCCWQTKGQGQFRPLENSKPYLGQKGAVETVTEWKLELVCEPGRIAETVKAMRAAHPYETPAYQVVRCEEY